MPQTKERIAQSITLKPDTPTKDITEVLDYETKVLVNIMSRGNFDLMEYHINNIRILALYLNKRFQNVH